MNTYVVLMRGINVGGKNKVPMADLRKRLEGLGFSNVTTYIASDNVILGSNKRAGEIKAWIEKALFTSFKLDAELISVLVLPRNQLQASAPSVPKADSVQSWQHRNTNP